MAKLFCFALAPALLAFAVPCAFAQGAAATLSIDTGAARARSSPMLYGLMTEEINYSYDGGLYGELVRNRVIHSGFGGMDHWSLVQQGMAKAAVSVDTATGPSSAMPASMKLEAASASPESRAGVENEGYWGIPLRPQTAYQASFYAKSTLADAAVTVTLLADDTGKPIVEQTVQHVGTAWQRYSVRLETPAGLAASPRNHLVLSVSQPGTLWVNLVSLFPPTYHDRKNGNRIDLMEKLAGMHPAFLRLPGGNYLEGDTIEQRFAWKKTIGPLVDRPTHDSPWGYRSTDGLGLLEFMEWCEDLRIEPVLAVYAGYSLKGEHVEPGPALAPYVQDALEEIEYLTGDSSTQWGAERGKDGHPEPFKLHYIEIGNEDWFDKSGSYNGRYAQFYDAIKAKYPQYELIATTPVANHRYDVVDDHYYRSAQEFYDDVDHYDHTDRRGPKVFVGEWATREGTPTPDFGAALGDAAWMTGMERNSDIVVMASYAPLLTNVNPGGLQWDTDLIGYNAMESYGSPSYYAQAMFSRYHGDEILKSSFSGSRLRLFESVTREAASGTLYLKLVNATTLPAPVTVQLSGGKTVAANGTMHTLTAPSREATNSVHDPTRIVPSERPLAELGASFTVTLAPLSINVLELAGQR